jgi:hypothetical protein
MPSVPLAEVPPTIALAVEPRLLRESLAHILERRANVIQISAGERGAMEAAPRYDIILMSAGSTRVESEADVVLWFPDPRSETPPDGLGQSRHDVRELEDILVAIDRWTRRVGRSGPVA